MDMFRKYLESLFSDNCKQPISQPSGVQWTMMPNRVREGAEWWMRAPRGASRSQQHESPARLWKAHLAPLCEDESPPPGSQSCRHCLPIAPADPPTAAVSSSSELDLRASSLFPITFIPPGPLSVSVFVPPVLACESSLHPRTMAAFIPGSVTAAAVGGRRRPALCTSRGATAGRTRVETRCLVVDVGSVEQLQVVLDSAKEADALVVIDYSTTWCGPCKVRAGLHISPVFVLSGFSCAFTPLYACVAHPTRYPVSQQWILLPRSMVFPWFAFC